MSSDRNSSKMANVSFDDNLVFGVVWQQGHAGGQNDQTGECYVQGFPWQFAC